MGGGQESTVMSTMPFFAHMGMIYVPLGTKGKKERPAGIPVGGSAWGAGTLASKLSLITN
jgi:NAD(P)H dehydrogenase (quinone)